MVQSTEAFACKLTSEQLRERRTTLLRVAGQKLQETVERDDGYAFRFPAEMLEELALMISLERQCCPFLRFTLTAEPNNGPVWLEVTGPAEAKSFVASIWS